MYHLNTQVVEIEGNLRACKTQLNANFNFHGKQIFSSEEAIGCYYDSG